MASRDDIYFIGQSILAFLQDVNTASCPDCGRADLDIHIDRKFVAIRCTSPKDFDSEIGEFTTCSFCEIIHLVDIKTAPFTMKFSVDDPRRRPIKAAPRKAPVKKRPAR